MKKILALVAMLSIAGVAVAQESNSNSNSGSSATSNAQGGQGGQGGVGGQGVGGNQQQGQGQGQNQTSNSNAETASNAAASNQGNNSSQAINFNSPSNVTSTSTITQNGKQEVHYSGSYKTVPNVYAPPVGVTAPCIVGWSAGISVIGVGLSAGTGTEDKECTKRENARMLHAFGEVKGAVALLCQNEGVYKAMPERCDLATGKEAPQVVIKEVPVEKIVEKIVYKDKEPVPTTKKKPTE